MIQAVSRQAAGLLILFSSLSFAATPQFGELIVFGDSLSDTGNIKSLVDAGIVSPDPHPSPPYAPGRFSNGPVAVEGLAAALGLDASSSLHLVNLFVGSNFAVGGARAARPGGTDLAVQVQAFLASRGGLAPSDALYVVMIGGNDIRAARGGLDAVPAKKDARALVAQAAAGVDQAIRALVVAGARSILVGNAPDIGNVPETALLAALRDDPKFAREARKLSKRYNRAIDKLIHGIEHDFGNFGVRVALFDVFDFLREVRADGEELGFINTDDACLNTLTGQFHPQCIPGVTDNQFVFFDLIHPSAAVHALAGEAMLEALEELVEERGARGRAAGWR